MFLAIRRLQKEKKESTQDKILKEYITIIYYDHKMNYGYRKIHAELRITYNLPISEKVVRRFMCELGFKSQARKEKRKSVNNFRVTSAEHIYENLLKREKQPELHHLSIK